MVNIMTTTQPHHLSDAEYRDALLRLNRGRNLKKTAAAAAFVLGGVALFGVTYLSYTSSPGPGTSALIGQMERWNGSANNY